MERTADKRPHVAVLDEELPWPLDSGKRLRTWHLLIRLARRFRITYLAHRHDASADAERALRHAGIRTVVVDRSIPSKKGIGFAVRLARNLFSSLPYSVATHHSAELTAAVRDLARRDPPALWHCEWTPYAEYMRTPPGDAPWLVMAHNVESLIWQRYVVTSGRGPKRWYIGMQQRKFERFERWAYSSCDRAIAVSDEDAAIMRSRFGGHAVDVVDNGVDTAMIVPDSSIARDPFRILFLGSLDWRPNIDGAERLLRDIFPQVLQREPRATLQLVGRNPSDALRRLAASPSVQLHANVPDVRPYLANAGILAVPLRVGGGSRLKILEALAAGLPVLTSHIGVEGLHLDAETHVTIADTVEEQVNRLLDMMHNPAAALEQATRGRARVLERYDWSGLAERLGDLWGATIVPDGSRKNQTAACLV